MDQLITIPSTNPTTKPCPQCTFINHADNRSCEVCHYVFNKITIDDIQRCLKSYRQQEKIDENYKQAYELIPESFFKIDMLYFACSINNQDVDVFIDTGAEDSIMSKEFAIKCGLYDLIDKRYKGKTYGVGEQEIYGKIWLVEIDLGAHSIPCSFTILEKFNFDVLFGLNMMVRHSCILDIKNRCMMIGELKVPFVDRKKIDS